MFTSPERSRTSPRCYVLERDNQSIFRTDGAGADHQTHSVIPRVEAAEHVVGRAKEVQLAVGLAVGAARACREAKRIPSSTCLYRVSCIRRDRERRTIVVSDGGAGSVALVLDVRVGHKDTVDRLERRKVETVNSLDGLGVAVVLRVADVERIVGIGIPGTV